MPVLGDRIVGPNGKDIAQLVDVLVDLNGQPVAAVLDFGGFMGVGSRKIAVHWSALHFEPAETTHRITLSLTPDEIKAAPGEIQEPGEAGAGGRAGRNWTQAGIAISDAARACAAQPAPHAVSIC